MGRRAMVVELQRDADHVVAGFALSSAAVTDEIDAARHGDDDARVGRPALDVETVVHGNVKVPSRRPIARLWFAPMVAATAQYYKRRSARFATVAALRRSASFLAQAANGRQNLPSGRRDCRLAPHRAAANILNLHRLSGALAGPPVASRLPSCRFQGSSQCQVQRRTSIQHHRRSRSHSGRLHRHRRRWQTPSHSRRCLMPRRPCRQRSPRRQIRRKPPTRRQFLQAGLRGKARLPTARQQPTAIQTPPRRKAALQRRHRRKAAPKARRRQAPEVHPRALRQAARPTPSPQVTRTTSTNAASGPNNSIRKRTRLR